jgi:hypothetical protein
VRRFSYQAINTANCELNQECLIVFGAATIAMKRVKAKSDADAQFTLKAQI